MSGNLLARGPERRPADAPGGLPLKIIWPGIPVVPVGTERADIPRRVVNKAMADHLVLALEPFTTLATWTPRDWAIMWSCRGMNIRVRVEQILRLEWLSDATGHFAHITSCCVDGHTVYAHPVETLCRRGTGVVRTRAFRRVASIIARTMQPIRLSIVVLRTQSWTGKWAARRERIPVCFRWRHRRRRQGVKRRETRHVSRRRSGIAAM